MRSDPTGQPLSTFAGYGGLQKKYFIKPLRATAVDIPTDKSNVIISLFPAGIRFWSRIMALFLSVFTRPVAEVNITEANRDKLEASWYRLPEYILGDMKQF